MSRPQATEPATPTQNSWYDQISDIPDPKWQAYWISARTVARLKGVKGSAIRAKFTHISEQHVIIAMQSYNDRSKRAYTSFQVTYKGGNPGVYQLIKEHIVHVPAPSESSRQ